MRVKNYIFVSLIFSVFSQASISDYLFPNNQIFINSYGMPGSIQLPNAIEIEEGTIASTFSSNSSYKYGSLMISPFNWLTASYFYYRPKDISGGGWPIGKYLDKGFNLRFNYSYNKNLTLALGLDDFAGTGFFTKEYLVSSLKTESAIYTLGIGTGFFNGINKVKNPLSLLDNSFDTRPTESKDYKLGGNPEYSSIFRGDLGIFGSIEKRFISIPNLSIIFEYDPFDYQEFGVGGLAGPGIEVRNKKRNFNYGMRYALNKNISFNASNISGIFNNISLVFKINFSKDLIPKKRIASNYQTTELGSNELENFYENVLYNLKQKEIFVQTMELEAGNLKVATSSSKFRNPILVHSRVSDIVNKANANHEIDIDSISTISVNVGHELHRVTTQADLFDTYEKPPIEIVAYYSDISPGKSKDYTFFKFRPTVNYPASFTGITPALVNHIGDPAKFYYGGIVLRLDNEIQFTSRLQLNTEIHQNVTNNFDDKRNFPDSLLPRVRTDIVSYLQESDTYISQMQLDYFFNPYRQIFGKFSAGLLENMYAGAGVEFLYKPFEQNFSLGLEAYRAKKRAFDRKFDLLDYETNTGHINFNYHLPQWGILGTLSYGKYLAGDEGYTFDISRRLSSGFRAGIFFTRTNVSAEQFGEGSFDKGFYFQIPIDLFLNDYRGGYINFKLRPLTRDGGQKLEAGNDLIGIMHSTSRAEIERDWGSFYD